MKRSWLSALALGLLAVSLASCSGDSGGGSGLPKSDEEALKAKLDKPIDGRAMGGGGPKAASAGTSRAAAAAAAAGRAPK
jgi:hypothetical protein